MARKELLASKAQGCRHASASVFLIQKVAAAALVVFIYLFGAERTALAEPAATAMGWATAQAVELTRQGSDHAARGNRDMALTRYLEAIRFDATYGPAYLALGALHEAGGDLRESERAYSMGIERVSGFADGLRARARVRSLQGRRDESIADLESATELRPEDLSTLRDLAAVYVAAGALPAALAISRRVAAVAEAQGNARVLTEARVTARALGALIAEADPVLSGSQARGSVRRAIALSLIRPSSGGR